LPPAPSRSALPAEVPAGAFRSTDSGNDWGEATTPPPGAFELFAVTYGFTRGLPPPPSTTSTTPGSTTSTTAPPATPAVAVAADPRFAG
jgi:hypothetical protein